MRQIQVSLDDETYDALEREAREREMSLSDVLRGLVREQLCEQPKKRPLRASDLSFVGIGDSGQKPGDPLYPISENHDEALAEGTGRSW